MAGEIAQPKVQYRVWTEIQPVLYIMAFLFDLLSLIPFVNSVIVFIGQILIAGMFAVLRVNVVSRKNWLWYVATWIAEFIPIASILPMFMFETWRMIFISKREDEINASALARKGAAVIASSQYVRARIQEDRRNQRVADQKKEAERPGSSRENTMANARGSRDLYKVPREEQRESEREKLRDPDAKSNVWNNISNYADRQPSFRQRPQNTPQSANDAPVSVDGVRPDVEEPA